jgi:alkanesulfonate monooxygenase SsuD/methylene tetrahydromethanopterin reductase-like flavin-dependent oxidoreductase (luciferase family)
MEAYGVAEKEYEERYLESIDVFFKSWASTPFSFKGKHWTIPAQLEGHVENKSGTVNVTPNPAQPQIPVWIGGFSEFARKVAGDLGLPMVLGAISKNQDAGKFFSEHEVKVQTRVANNPRILIRDVYVSNSANPMAECQEMLERQFVRYKNWKLWDGEIDNFAELAKGRFIIGTPEEVIDQIRYLEDNFGIDQLVCRMHFPGMPLHQLLKSMQLFSSDVIPEFAMPNLPSQIRLGI